MTRTVTTTITSTSSNNYRQELDDYRSRPKGREVALDDLKKIDIVVYDGKDKDVTRKLRPDGRLNHAFYIHPEDGKYSLSFSPF